MSRPYPDRPRKHKGKPPPNRYGGSSRKPRPEGYSSFGAGKIYDALAPGVFSHNRRRAFNHIADRSAITAALTAAALGLQSAGIVGAVVGLGAGYAVANRILVGYRFIRR